MLDELAGKEIRSRQWGIRVRYCSRLDRYCLRPDGSHLIPGSPVDDMADLPTLAFVERETSGKKGGLSGQSQPILKIFFRGFSSRK